MPLKSQAIFHSNTSPDGVGVELSWDGGVSYTSAGKTALFTESETSYILGAGNDTWGRIWSSSELNNANFRLRIDDGVAYQDYYNFDLAPGAIIRGIEVSLEGYDDLTNDYVDQIKVRVYADHIYIPPSSPIAYFTASPKTGENPLTVQFSNESIGEITNYLWDFGNDGEISNLENPTHIYELPGTYTVSLTVTGPYGSKTKTQTDYIKVVIPVPTITNISPTKGEVGSQVIITGTGFGATQNSSLVKFYNDKIAPIMKPIAVVQLSNNPRSRKMIIATSATVLF